VIEPAALTELLPDYLPRQRWFGASDREVVKALVVDAEIYRHEFPVLLWTMVEVTFTDGPPNRYQLWVGLRHLNETRRFLEGKGRSFLGDVDTEAGPALAYDAVIDPDLAVDILARVAPSEQVTRMRALGVEQSNTSIVYDERVILKLFRRLHEGPNPDVELTEALTRVGFGPVAREMGVFRRGGYDLAVAREFLAGAVEGWQLALTSLRDLYDRRLAPEESGGDFAPDAERLGRITAEMHLALAESLGVSAGDPARWAAEMDGGLEQVTGATGPDRLPSARIATVYRRLAGLTDAGPAIRIHGDFHLGQMVETDTGWYVLDFEGEPVVSLEERRRPSSPLRDVAGMLRSFHYAQRVALRERGVTASTDSQLKDLGDAWEARAAEAFLTGYLAVEGITALLPPSDQETRVALEAFALGKAVYEVGYELSHRPDWVEIPLEAVARMAS
jgi:maltokinase